MHKRKETSLDGRPVITIGFFEPKEQEQNSCFSSLTSFWTRREGHSFSHVELRFSDGTTTSVTQDAPVHFKERLLSNPNYTRFFKITVDKEKEHKMMQMAKRFHDEKVEFNLKGVWWNFLPLLRRFPIQSNGQSVFCSEYIVLLLQEADLLLAVRPETTSPNDLFLELEYLPEAHYGINTAMFHATGGTARPLSMSMLYSEKGK